MKRITLTIMATLCALSLSAQKVDRVEPLSWFTDMKTPLQLMLHGDNIADAKVTVDNEGLVLRRTITTDNPNYLFLDLDVVAAGDWEITLKKGRKKHTFTYHIDSRREGSAERESFSSKDVVYLIMPDRFANGDPSNDVVSECAEGCNRSEPFGRHGGDIQGIIDHLDYIDDLGATAIWCTPLTLDNESFASYHGYSCSDYYHIDPRYGTNELCCSFDGFIAAELGCQPVDSSGFHCQDLTKGLAIVLFDGTDDRASLLKTLFRSQFHNLGFGLRGRRSCRCCRHSRLGTVSLDSRRSR